MTLPLTSWQTPPSHPELCAGVVHLWRFPLACQESFDSLLNDEEIKRAGRLRAAEKSRDFVVARARLRQILASYLDVAPETLTFKYGPSGKPALEDSFTSSLAFNLSHSGCWGLCAVTSGAEVGVDIERLDRNLDYAKLAARFFSESERDWLQAASSPRRRRQFFRLWTRKEAWLKGKGGGFSDPDQDLGPDPFAASSTCDGTWWLRSFPVARNYLATLALSQEFSLVQRWDAWPLSE